jgi:hypothetical protein
MARFRRECPDCEVPFTRIPEINQRRKTEGHRQAEKGFLHRPSFLGFPQLLRFPPVTYFFDAG